MLPAFLAVFCAFLPQTEPPPDTKAARERHRLIDKNAPPPGGPWGPEEFGFTWHTPVWRGAFLLGGTYAGSSIRMSVPRGTAARSDGINPPEFEHLEYHDERIRATSFGLLADLDIVRLSITGFDGDFDARASLTLEDGFNPPQPRDVDIDGDAYGFRVGVHWPAFRYRDTVLEGSLGPIATVGWLHQETDAIPTAQFLRHDTLDVLTGSFGAKLSLRWYAGKFALEADAEYSFMAGAARGWMREFQVGLGYKF
jgi:hypothetical protein